jgi:hypothetical protein
LASQWSSDPEEKEPAINFGASISASTVKLTLNKIDKINHRLSKYMLGFSFYKNK